MKRIVLTIISCLCLASTTMAQERWTLKKCIEHAEKNNVDLKLASLDIKDKKLEKNTAKWAMLPSLNASVGQDYNWGRTQTAVKNDESGEYSTVYVNTSSQSSSASVSTSIPIFTGMSISNRYKLTKLNLKAAMADYDQAKQDLKIQVTSSFLQVVFSEELLEVAQADMKITETQKERVESLVQMGKLAPVELADAEARLAKSKLQLVEAENAYRMAALALCQLIELDYTDNFKVERENINPSSELLVSPDEIYNSAIVNRGDMRAATLRIESGRKMINISKAAFMPKISLNAGLGTRYYSTIDRSFSKQLGDNYGKYIGISLNIPIFNRMENVNRYRQSKVNFDRLNLQLEASKKRVRKDIERAYTEAVNARERYDASILAAKAAGENFLLVQKKYEYGNANALEFDEARNDLFKSKSSVLQAKYEYVFKVRLLKLLEGYKTN